jgi:hypothetical protein
MRARSRRFIGRMNRDLFECYHRDPLPNHHHRSTAQQNWVFRCLHILLFPLFPYSVVVWIITAVPPQNLPCHDMHQKAAKLLFGFAFPHSLHSPTAPPPITMELVASTMPFFASRSIWIVAGADHRRKGHTAGFDNCNRAFPRAEPAQSIATESERLLFGSRNVDNLQRHGASPGAEAESYWVDLVGADNRAAPLHGTQKGCLTLGAAWWFSRLNMSPHLSRIV